MHPTSPKCVGFHENERACTWLATQYDVLDVVPPAVVAVAASAVAARGRSGWPVGAAGRRGDPQEARADCARETVRQSTCVASCIRFVRFRADLDVLVIQQYLASLEAFVGVALPALHYLATEVTLLTLSDGDILCYQIDGSLCGYFNKAFSQRPNARESFQVWNARQTRRHGVLVDFGEFQSTYSNGALCGFDDLIQGRSQKGKSQLESLSRRKGIDTLQSDISYLGICSQLSEYEKSKLLQTAPRCRLAAGKELCPPSDDDTLTSILSTSDGQVDAFIIVLYGRLDVFWDGDEDAFMEFSASTDSSNTAANLPELNEELPPAAFALAERNRLEELAQLRKTPLASIRRGQTFGDQMLGLALDKLYPGAQLTSTSVPIRLRSGDAATEIIWISKALYEEHLREDRVSLSYHPLSSAASASSRFAGEFKDWALQFFSKKAVFDRDPSDLGKLSRRMLADSKISKLLFQFPPLVLERVCHAMELRHFTSDGLFMGIGDDITHISIVVRGALRILAPPAFSASAGNKNPLSRTASAFSTGNQVAAVAKQQQDVFEQFVPGDVFGAVELVERSAASATSSRVVYVEAETLLLSVPKIVFERWLAPLYVDTIFNAGSCFQSLVTSGPSGGSGRSLHADKRGAKPAASPTRRHSVVVQSTSESELLNTNCALEQESSLHSNALEDATHLLRKMGILPLIPRFLLSEMLQHTSVVYKQAGDVLFHEGEESQYLVVLLTGFMSFYSLEHMSTTIEMFQKHSFCRFSSFQGSQTNPEDFVADGIADETTSSNRSTTIAKHRAAMHGVHIQTLHAGNAFRTGVLLDGTICPATVVAQTDCECLVLEESVYLQLLKAHTPVVDLGKFEIPMMTAPGALNLRSMMLAERDSDENDNDDIAPPPPGSLRSIIAQRNPTTLHPAVVRCFEKAHVPWLARSPLKMQQLLRGMRCISVNPGERLIRCNDVLDHLIIVLSGKLCLYIRQNEDVSTFLDASQRSVRSLMLERSVMSNYSTTSQQLYKEAHGGGGGGGSSTGAGARGRVGSRQDAFTKRKVIRSKISRISESGLFVDSVLAAVHEGRLKKRAAAGGNTTDTTGHSNLDASPPRKPESPSSLSRGHSRPTPSLLIHSAAAKTKLHQKIDTRRSTILSQDGSGTAGSLFLCNLGPGEVFGDEILAPHGIFRSVHDVFVDNSVPSAASTPVGSGGGTGLGGSPGKSASFSVANNPGGAQLLLLDRQLFHSINSKTDAEIEKELHVRSKLAKIKWHSAECKIMRKLSQASINGDHSNTNGGGGKATSKLFDLFKNILNQRCFLTMRTIADIPLLRDLPDSSKREICLAARFEALERGMNAYKDNGAHNSAPRYYILISGRLGLYAKNLNGSFFAYSNIGGGGSNNISATTGGAAVVGAENCLREVLPGDGFGEFEILVPELSNRCISALALESCRLLSFPASTFLKHWSRIASMKSDIEYLRTRVPFFSRLELEKIAYLYTTLSFQTFTRGSNIFEQNHTITDHFSNSGELYLLKEGSCSIRQRVVLDSQQADGKVFVSTATKAPDASWSGGNPITRLHTTQQKLPTHRPHHPEKHLFRVMVTVADVCDGHLFWIDGGGGGGANDATFPFTLQAVSASVTITNIAIDKLRAILPRTKLAALEKASNQMAALYKQQYAMAQRAVVTLMNEKRAAQMGMTTNPTFLPILNFESPQKFIPGTTSSSVSSDASIPFSRLLMSRPVDLVALQDQERDAIQRAKPEDPLVVADDDTSISQGYAAREWRGAVDAAYRNQHLSEHYQLENGLPNSTLVGSFPDDFSLRRRRRSIEQSALEKTNKSPNTSSQRNALHSSFLKQDECMEPESATPASNTGIVEGTTPTKLNDSASHIHLEVKVPIFHDSSRALNPRVPTPPSSARPKSRSGVLGATSSSSNMTPRSPRFSPGFQEVRDSRFANDDDDRFFDLEIDLRALLRAEMKDADAPMRTIKLEPSLSKANALGQYLAFSVSSSSSSPVTRPTPQHLPANPSVLKPKFNAFMPFKIFPRAKSTVKQTPVVPFSGCTSSTPQVSNHATLIHSEQASVRKQGFLCVVAVLDPETPLASVLSRAMQQHTRRFFSLVDNCLVEYPENIAISEPLDTTRSLSKYPLDEHSGVSDVPTTTIAAGEAQAPILRMSFVLAVASKTRLLLTTESPMEKKKWMNELRQACALGPRIPMHQKILHTQQDILASLEYNNSALQTPRTSHQSSRGQGRPTSLRNAADAGADLVLQVEYRIG